MSFVLRRDRSFPRNVSIVALGQLRRAIGTARDDKHDPAERVHDARTRCKRLRALLRMIEPSFPAFEEENAAIRDAASGLSRTRDRSVTLAALDALLKDMKGVGTKERTRLTDALAGSNGGESPGDILAHFAEAIEPIAVRAALWHTAELGWEDAVDGTAKAYGKARRAMARANETQDAADFHEWRKQTKYHLFHLTLLREVTPDWADRRKQMKRLAAILGEHHDLHVLGETLSHTLPDDDLIAERLWPKIARRQEKLANDAVELGQPILSQGKGEFADQLVRLLDL